MRIELTTSTLARLRSTSELLPHVFCAQALLDRLTATSNTLRHYLGGYLEPLNGGVEGLRSPYLLLAKQALSRLSYDPYL